jgi:hypothetical protein
LHVEGDAVIPVDRVVDKKRIIGKMEVQGGVKPEGEDDPPPKKKPLKRIIKKLPKVNKRPKGENSPNLVTLTIRFGLSLQCISLDYILKCFSGRNGNPGSFEIPFIFSSLFRCASMECIKCFFICDWRFNLSVQTMYICT